MNSAVGRRAKLLLLLSTPPLVALVAYAPFITGLGFYRDDVFNIWALANFSNAELVDMFSVHRPLLGHLYVLTSSALGLSPLGWHVYATVLRLTTGFVIYWIVFRTWPRARAAAYAIMFLVIVYPGFMLQPVAQTYQSHQTAHVLALLSIALALEASSSGKLIWRLPLVALALAAQLAYLLLYEYMIGLEMLRFLILWNAAHSAPLRAGRREPRYPFAAAPYAVVLIAFAVWRLFLFKSPAPAADAEFVLARAWTHPSRALLRLLVEPARDMIEAVLLAWFVPLSERWSALSYRQLLEGSALALFASVPAAAALSHVMQIGNSSGTDSAPDELGHSLARVGLLSLLSVVMPIVVMGRDIRFHSDWDRYALTAAGPVALLITGLLHAGYSRALRRWLIAGLIALAILFHYANGAHYRDFWQAQRAMWWQLSWRAPDLQDGTVLLVDIPYDSFREDFEIWAAAELVYGQGGASPRLVAEVLSDQTAEKVRFGVVERRDRITWFMRDFKQVLVLSLVPGSCLRVVDPTRIEWPRSTGALVRSIARYSDIDLVLASASPRRPPEEVFGLEPPREWCYYYQKASLARQVGDWGAVVALGEEVASRGLRPSDRSEWMPFLEGYVALGHEPRSEAIAREIRAEEPVRHSLCDSLRVRPVESLPVEHRTVIFELLCE